MTTGVTWFLLVFYAGAAAMTAMAWLSAWRGVVSYSALRDLSGIADRAVLRRFFGGAWHDGLYRITLPDILRHRRRAGLILSDLPLHLAFLLALVWANEYSGAPAALAVVCAASLHAAVVATAALFIAAADRQAISP